MVRSRSPISAIDIQRYLKDGRGQGDGKNYKPWLTIRDVPSKGRSHRIYSHLTGRVHQLLSDLELAVFLGLEWSTRTIDIREQFPLKLDETQSLALENGIRHPNINGVDQVMTSDFLVDSNDSKFGKFVLQAKYTTDLSDNRVIEKLQLERLFWNSKSIPWKIVTEKNISKITHENINWLNSGKHGLENLAQASQQLPFFKKLFTESPDSTMVNACKKFDFEYNQELGISLRDVRILMAYGFIKCDITKKISSVKCNDICFYDVLNTEMIQDVAG